MKISARVINIVLILILLLSSVFGNIYIRKIFAEEEPADGRCGEKCFWELDSEKGELRIWGQGVMEDFESVSDVPWKNSRALIRKVIIEEGVYRLGDRAFCGCTEMEEVHIPIGVYMIGRSCFYGCRSMNSIDIPEGVEYIKSEAFRDCYSLTTVNMPSTLYDIGTYVFTNSGLKSLILPLHFIPYFLAFTLQSFK